MSAVVTPEIDALARCAVEDLGAGPGVLADYLEERGDSRGRPLRDYWRGWAERRRRAVSADVEESRRWVADPALARLLGEHGRIPLHESQDSQFRWYLRSRFIRAKYGPPPVVFARVLEKLCSDGKVELVSVGSSRGVGPR